MRPFRAPFRRCRRTAWVFVSWSMLAGAAGAADAPAPFDPEVDRLSSAVEANVIGYRRHIHQHPELSNREVETAKYVADHLRRLGIEVETGIARTGVVGVLRGGKPGPVVALRADMDALPVTEEVDLPFASKVRSTYNGQDVGVMHACGHDAHVAVLMGAAEVLAKMRDRIPGTVKLIFQPAEEGPPPGEEGGARIMVQEGVLSKDPQPAAIFGLHVTPLFEAGQIGYRAGGMLASGDVLRITVRGRQTHGAAPWGGVDPVTVAAQIVLGLQTIPSRQLDITRAPALVSIGSIHGGVRENIIPEQVELLGTIRALDRDMHEDFRKRIRRTAEQIAESAGATAEVVIEERVPVTFNDPDLTRRMLPTLRRTAGDANVLEAMPVLGGEDFAYYQEKIPGFFVWLGIRTPGADSALFAPNHSPRFRIDESALRLGVRTLVNLALDSLATAAPDPVATFSILGFDPETGEVGGAVQSRVFSVGNGVLWAEAGVGAVATQAIVDISYGPQSMELLRKGVAPQEVIDRVWKADPDPWPKDWTKQGRQFAVINAKGETAAFTGPKASTWAGHKAGKHCTAQGNILAGEAVVAKMVEAFETTKGHLSYRLLAALEAGQKAGGDTRGMQSAAMLIVKKDGGVWLHNDVVLRLQVDDHKSPIAELRRLVDKQAELRASIADFKPQ